MKNAEEERDKGVLERIEKEINEPTSNAIQGHHIKLVECHIRSLQT